jgi:hypothetical protein
MADEDQRRHTSSAVSGILVDLVANSLHEIGLLLGQRRDDATMERWQSRQPVSEDHFTMIQTEEPLS